MRDSRIFLRNVFAIFVWMWTVFTISLHLSTIEIGESETLIGGTCQSMNSLACFDMMTRFNLAIGLTLLVKDKSIPSAPLNSVSLSERSNGSTGAKRRKQHEEQRSAKGHKGKKQATTEDCHDCEEDDDEELSATGRKRKRKRLPFHERITSAS